jgi:hypothetical protein
VFDSRAGKIVRLSATDLAMLDDDDVWHSSVPRGIEALLPPRRYDMLRDVVVHDPASRVTLLIGSTVYRVDAAACTPVATLDLLEGRFVHAFNAAERTLELQFDQWSESKRAQIDLAPAFDRAAAAGP